MLIALTGGIGSGKSTVASEWVQLGATEIDADLLAREVVEPGTVGLNLVLEAFGKDLLLPDGSLNRGELAKRAFSSENERKRLEAILHPLIQQLALQKVSQSQGVTIYTIPLLVETKSPLSFDKVVTISCPEDVRIERLIRKGFSKDEALRRIAAQANDEQRKARADLVIDSDCTIDELRTKAREVFMDLVNG
jgi:dephospho-CoA kinase